MYATVEERPQVRNEEPRDIYVHLMNGEVVTLDGVVKLELTDHDIELKRRGMAPVRFPRSEVFFTTASADDTPPPC
jgi:hypothetical protein